MFEVGPQLLPREDPDGAAVLKAALDQELTIEYNVKFVNIEYTPPPGGNGAAGGGGGGAVTKGPWGLYKVTVDLGGSRGVTVFECEALLNATGRTPNVDGLGLDKVRHSTPLCIARVFVYFLEGLFLPCGGSRACVSYDEHCVLSVRCCAITVLLLCVCCC